MHYFLYARLEGFYTTVLLQNQPELRERPLVVHRDKAVLCVDEKGRSKGIHAGMPLSEAKAILRDGTFLPWEEEPYRDAQEKWLDVCAQFSDVIEPVEQHAAFVDLSAHPDPTDIALQLSVAFTQSMRARDDSCPRLCSVDRRHKPSGSLMACGMAGSKWIAELAARPLTGNKIEDELRLREPVLDPAGFIAPLPVSLLLPVDKEHRQRLLFLGYRTIGEVTSLSLATLRRQFGQDGLKIYQAAWSGCFEPVQALYPRDAIQDRFSFEGEADCVEVLENGLGILARRLSDRLRDKDLQGSQLSAWVDFDDAPQERFERTFVKPLHTARSIFVGLRAMMGDGKIAPTAIRVRMSNLAKARRRQADLYGSLAEKTVGTERALEQVRGVFGDDIVQLAAQVAEPRRKRLMRVWKDATGWR